MKTTEEAKTLSWRRAKDFVEFKEPMSVFALL